MDLHNIQTEKAKAMARYRRIRNLAKIWRLIEVVIALSVVSWSSSRLPTAAKFVGDFAGKLTALFCAYAFKPLIVFAIFNAIILFIFLFSRQKPDGEEAEDENPELVMFTEADFMIDTPPVVEEEKRMVAVAEEEKQIVGFAENVVVVKEEFEAVDVAIEKAKRQIKKFERTQSNVLKRDLHRGKSRHELRRSETDIKANRSANERAITVFKKNERADSVFDKEDEKAVSVLERVNSLSSEEFQKTIDAFIAKQQKFLLAQKMAESELVE